MTTIKYVKGDATAPKEEGRKILIHCCNDCVPGKWGSGFVLAISRRWSEPKSQYVKWSRGKTDGPLYELGNVQFVKVEEDLVIGNMLGQKGVKKSAGAPPIRYSAIRKCLKRVAMAAKKNNACVCCPKFGADRAGGSWDKIEEIIIETLCEEDIEVTVYELGG